MALEGLSEAVSSGSVVTQPEILGGYGAGDSVKGVMPDAVVFPESVEEVSRVALWARQAGMKLIACLERRPAPRRRGAVRRLRGRRHVAHEDDSASGSAEPRGAGRGRPDLRRAGRFPLESRAPCDDPASAAQGQVGRRGIPRPDPHACAAGAVGPLRPAPLHRGGDGIGDGLSYRLLRRPRNARGAVGDRPGAEEPDGPLGL